MNRRAQYVAAIAATLVIIGASIAAYHTWQGRPGGAVTTQTMSGSLFVSDAGRSHGGFEYTASWNATLALTGNDTGSIRLTLDVGLGDALTNHNLTIANFARNSSTVSMLVDGQPVTMKWTANDTTWDQSYDNYYIASWGSDSPQTEIIGRISPSTFPGLHDFWYVELRLR